MQYVDSDELVKLDEDVKKAILDWMPVEDRVRGLSAEERIRGLPVEERVRGLSPEELAAALTEVEIARFREFLDRKAGK